MHLLRCEVQVRGKEKEMFHYFSTEQNQIWVNWMTFRTGMEKFSLQETPE